MNMRSKIRRGTTGDQANLLITVIVTLAIVCLAIAAVMSLASQRNRISARSLVWNNAMPVAEAGIEEALTQIQYAMPPTNGWTLSGSYYTRTRTNLFGDSDKYYVVNIQNTNPPVITATGFVRAPLDSAYIYRTVRVTTRQPGRFPYGMLAKGLITMNNGKMDSFASCDSAYSSNGVYTASTAHDQMKVATLSTANPAIKVGGADIYGYVNTGAGGTVTYSGGAVGDAAYVNGGGTGGQTGHEDNTMNISIPDATPPCSSGTAPLVASLTVNGTNYSSTLTAPTNFVNGDFTISSSPGMIVTNNALLYVAGTFKIQGSGFIYIAPGASLNLYVGVTNTSANDVITISGGAIANGTGNAANFSLVGLPSVKRADYTGSAHFIGTLYAPNADFTLSGGGDASGALVAKTILVNSGSFHYDECLGQNSSFLKYIVMSWREL